ncbi:MAG: hypothetical protein MRY32_05465 [Rickettsiales bacterium]|nr:hypothetical protein [Rickettsiales bacterium]
MQLPKSLQKDPEEEAMPDPLASEPKRKRRGGGSGGDALVKFKEKAEGLLGRFSTPKKRFILMIGDEGAIMVLMSAGRVTKRLFAASPMPEHTAEIAELMEQNPGVPVTFLIDMMDQSYVRHSLPPVSRLSIGKLVKRRLERDFSPDDVTGAYLLGRDKDNRNEWNYLLISLANSVSLQQWLDLVMELPNRFTGIHLVPLEAQTFIREISNRVDKPRDTDEAQWKLLVAHDKVSGFRQIVLKDDVLVFTRLTQAGDVTAGSIAGNIEQEILNTIEYLRRLSFQDSAGLELYVVASEDVCRELSDSKLGVSYMKCLSPFEISEMLDLQDAALTGDRFADVVLAARFAKAAAPAIRLMPSFAVKLTYMYQGQLALRALLALSLIWGGLAISEDMVAAGSVQTDLDAQNAQLRSARQRVTTAEDRLGSLGEDQGDVLNIATLYRGTLKSKPLPLEPILRLVQITSPTHYIEDFKWDVQVVDPRTSRNQSSHDEEEKEPINFAFSVRFEGHELDRKVFIEMANTYLDRLEGQFNDYEVAHDPLPGVAAREENLVLNFDDEGLEQDRLEENQAVLRVRIKGPIKQEKEKIEGQE